MDTFAGSSVQVTDADRTRPTPACRSRFISRNGQRPFLFLQGIIPDGLRRQPRREKRLRAQTGHSFASKRCHRVFAVPLFDEPNHRDFRRPARRGGSSSTCRKVILPGLIPG
jgi:hypothetical protein